MKHRQLKIFLLKFIAFVGAKNEKSRITHHTKKSELVQLKGIIRLVAREQHLETKNCKA